MKVASALVIFAMLLEFLFAGENMRLEMKYNGARFAVLLEDNPASRELIAQLPLELEFSDYAQKRKDSAFAKTPKRQKYSKL